MRQSDHSISNHSTVLAINGGSSSIKFALYEKAAEPVRLLSGKITRIGTKGTEFIVSDPVGVKTNRQRIGVSGFPEAAAYMLDWLEKQRGFARVAGIGHRVVHGLRHSHTELIDEDLLAALRGISAYDPDHLPAEIAIIRLFRGRHPHLLQVACFDTAFHAGMPRVAQLLPIPRRFDQEGVRRYGFHGISYAYLMEALRHTAGPKVANGRVILAHLGNGASMAAVKEGKSMDTTMGFTPAGGLVMGTRSGDMDPGAAWYMIKSEGMRAMQFNHVINHESGLLGISETSADMQDLLERENADGRAAEAVDLFCYQARKWIGAFMAVLGGLDALVFSGGIGENAPVIRSRICEGFHYAGLDLDESQNESNAPTISAGSSAIRVFVIPTDEECMIARNTLRLLEEAGVKT